MDHVAIKFRNFIMTRSDLIFTLCSKCVRRFDSLVRQATVIFVRLTFYNELLVHCSGKEVVLGQTVVTIQTVE